MEGSKLKANPLFDVFSSALISGTISTILLQPLDVIKTRIQSYHIVNAPHRSQGHVGVLKITTSIIYEERLSTLWRGLVPSLWRSVPGMGLYFTGVHLFTSGSSPSSLRAATAGLVSRAMVAVLLAPFTVVKTRFESKSFTYTSVSQALGVIFRTEGVKGLWSGTSAIVLRDAPYSGLYLMFYTQLKTLKPSGLNENSSAYVVFQLTSGGVAGVAATLVTQPFDVIKTRIQLNIRDTRTMPNESKIIKAIFSIFKEHGILGFAQGFVPRMLKRTLMSAISWTIFEQSTRIISKKEEIT